MAIVTNGLVGYWNSLQGISGSTWQNIAPGATGSNGTITNASVGSFNGSTGMVFNGTTNTHVDITVPTALQSVTSATLEMRVNMSSAQSSNGTYPDFITSTDKYLLYVVTGTIWLSGIFDSNRTDYRKSVPGFTDNADNYITITADTSANLITIYINGVSKGSYTPTSIAPLSDTTIFSLGNNPSGDSSMPNGIIDNVRLYNRVLTQSEITQNYQNGTAVGLPPTSTSNVQILVHGSDYTNYVHYNSISVDNNIVASNDTMSFTLEFDPDSDTLLDENSNTVPATRPRCGQEVIWQNPNVFITAPDGTQQPFRDFAGVISDVKEDVNGSNLVYQVQAKSYTTWFDRHLVTGFFNQDAPENIIKNIVSKYCSGFTTYNVQSTNAQVATQYFDYKKPSEAIKDIADQLEMGFYLDNYKDVHFYTAETFTSPLPDNLLDVDNDVQNYGDLELEENGDQVYTKVFLKGFKTRSSTFTLLTFIGNANDNQWSLGYRPSSATGDVSVVVYNNMTDYTSDTSFQGGGANTKGVALTVKRDLVDGSPNQQSASNTAYVNYSEKLLRVPNFNNAGNLPSGYVVAIRFYYLRDMVYLAQDPSASSAIAAIEGTDGVYEFAQTDKSLTGSTLSAPQSKGQLMLMKYGAPQVKGTFNTYFNATNSRGWIAGQYFVLRTQRRFGGLNEIMFVQRVTKSVVKNDANALIVLYAIEFADSQYLV